MISSRFLGLSLGFAAILAALVACGDDPEGTADGEDAGTGDESSPDGGAPVPAEFGLDTRPANPTCKAPARPASTAPVTFERVYQNVELGEPMMMAQRPGDASRWYIADREGEILYFASTNPQQEPDIALSFVNNRPAGMPALAGLEGEGGLLGLAFHPNFATNGKLYVSFTATPVVGGSSMRSIIGELTSSNGGNTFTAYKEILSFNQPGATNHKGGGIAFGKDGFLYVSFGDGGGGDDPYSNGQKTTGFFSKVLRLDIDNVPQGQNYGIPDGNPFKGGGGEPAVYAYGFRNPFRISIDRESGQLWVGDVGQNQWEEIDQVKVGGNYGWPCREGLHAYLDDDDGKCPVKTGFQDPLVEHQHVPANSRSITGGIVYRGKAIPSLVGTYIYGDYVKQELWALSYDSNGAPTTTRLNETGPANPWGSFAEDVDGELYAIGLNGQMFKVVATPGGQPDTFPDTLSKTGCFDPADAKKPAAGLIPYGVNAQLWSDGAEKERFIALPDGKTITVGADGDFDFPLGTVLVKSFKVGGKYVETRLFIRHDDDVWAGYSYEWNDAQTDATLLRSNKTKSVGTQSWYYPSRIDCLRCHTQAAGRSLGLELGQQNGEFVYASTNRLSNQLKTLDHIGLFSAALGDVTKLPAIPDPHGSAPLDQRARAYLHSNCSNCHRPEGGGRGEMDLRFTNSFADTKTCNVDSQEGDLGVDGAKLLVPREPGKSLISIRPRSAGANRMPPIATSLVDTKGVELLDAWINSLTACP